jgi:hypothetical protein
MEKTLEIWDWVGTPCGEVISAAEMPARMAGERLDGR